MIDNKKGWISWFNPIKYGIDRWLFALHRLTGIAIGLYLIAHIFETSNILRGPITWNSVMVFLDWPFGVHLGPYILSLLLIAVVFHAFNGLRLTIVENGLMLTRPYRPDYPYVPKSLKGWNLALKILTAILMIVIGVFGIIYIFTGVLI